MTTAPPPAPPPPPPCAVRPGTRPPPPPPPRPGHAALPFYQQPPVQETSPLPEALHQDAPAPLPPPPPVGNFPEFPPLDDLSGGGEKSGPVQETEPAAQTQLTERLDEASVLDRTAEDGSR